MAGSVKASGQWDHLPKGTFVDLTDKSDAERLDDLLEQPFKWVDLSCLELSFEVFSSWVAKVAKMKEDGVQIVVPRRLINANLLEFDSLAGSVSNMRITLLDDREGCYQVNLNPLKLSQRGAAVSA